MMLSPSEFRCLLDDFRRRPVVAKITDLFVRRGWQSVFFGGVPRSLMFGEEPRDVDIVVDCPSMESLRQSLSSGDIDISFNSFGAIKFSFYGVLFDVWPLKDTRYFVDYESRPNLPALLKSTHLTTDAIYADVRPGGDISTSSAFDASMRHCRIDLNWAETSFPEKCIIRAVVTAKKLDFFMSSGLEKWIRRTLADADMAKLEAEQVKRYGRVVVTAEEIAAEFPLMR